MLTKCLLTIFQSEIQVFIKSPGISASKLCLWLFQALLELLRSLKQWSTFCSCSFLSGFFITQGPWVPRKAMYGLQKAKNTLKCLTRFYEYVTIGIFLGETITFIVYSKGSFSPQRLRINVLNRQLQIICFTFLIYIVLLVSILLKLGANFPSNLQRQ